MDKSLKIRHSEFSKFRLKESNGTINFKEHRIKRDVNKLPVGSLATLKRKFDSGIRLHVHLRARTETIEGYPSEYCATFYLGMVDSLKTYLPRDRNFNPSLCSVGSNTDSLDITYKENNLNETMFVGVVNISEKGQRSVPCLIRLQALNNCPLNVSQSSYSIFADVPGNICFEETFTIPDGEFDVLSKQRVPEKPKLPEKVVKRRPQVIADITNEQGKFGGDVFQLLKPEQALSCLSLSYKVVDDSIGLTLQEPLHQVINDLEMVVSSAEFEKRAIERMHILYTPTMKDMRANVRHNPPQEICLTTPFLKTPIWRLNQT